MGSKLRLKLDSDSCLMYLTNEGPVPAEKIFMGEMLLRYLSSELGFRPS